MDNDKYMIYWESLESDHQGSIGPLTLEQVNVEVEILDRVSGEGETLKYWTEPYIEPEKTSTGRFAVAGILLAIAVALLWISVSSDGMRWDLFVLSAVVMAGAYTTLTKSK